MHFLLIPYGLLTLFFLANFSERKSSQARGGAFLFVALTVALLFMTLWFREPSGDSWRYWMSFQKIRLMSFTEAISLYSDTDILFLALNWLIGHIGNSHLVLFGATLILFFGVFIAAVRKLLKPVAVLAVIMSYVAFPYFIAYATNGLRQGLSMSFLLMGYVLLFRNDRKAWIWILLAPLWHSGAWLAVAATVTHQIMCTYIRKTSIRWALVFLALGIGIMFSATGINESIMTNLTGKIQLRDSFTIYFQDPDEFGYRSGFRLDYLLFSLIPLITAVLLRLRSAIFDYKAAGWWLSLYLSLNVIYHLFSFAPFSDRFGGFSWLLMPLVIYLQIPPTKSKQLQTVFVATVSIVNLVMLQFYTGDFIKPPAGW